MKECRWRVVAPSRAARSGSSATGGPRHRTFRQGLVALVLSTAAGFVAGLTLAHLTGTLTALPGPLRARSRRPWACKARSSARSARGSGTANAAGLLTIDLRPGGVLRRNVVVAVLTTFSSALWLAVLARIASPRSPASRSIPLERLLDHRGRRRGDRIGPDPADHGRRCPRLSTRLGWDLDSVSTPMVTALGDMTTHPQPVPRDRCCSASAS